MLIATRYRLNITCRAGGQRWNYSGQTDVPPRGVANLRDTAEMRQRVAEVPNNRRGAPDFDPLVEIKYRETYPALSLTPPAEQKIDQRTGVSCPAGEMVMFELIYPLPSCYEPAEPMTLVLHGIRVGDVDIDPVTIEIVKRQTKYTVED